MDLSPSVWRCNETPMEILHLVKLVICFTDVKPVSHAHMIKSFPVAENSKCACCI